MAPSLSNVVAPNVSAIGGRKDNHGSSLDRVDGYERYHALHGGDVSARRSAYADMVNKYYDLATSFYEYGWGQSFHFGVRYRGETLQESIKRHEHYLAMKLGVGEGSHVLDVGCGIGGPLREIATFTGAGITGLNNNEHQIGRAEEITREAGRGLSERCQYVKGDFMQLPFEEGTFDAVYQIEATCHAPSLKDVYSEVLRVLKPGKVFAGYEWCLTDAYDEGVEEHRRIKQEIEIGNGLPDIKSCQECLEALRAAGFEILEAKDLSQNQQVPWYEPLDPNRFSLSAFRTTSMGRFITRNFVRLLEMLRIAPPGSSRVSNFLEEGADGLVAGGKMNLFTPMFFFVAMKPN